jgi:enoyl-CoA hydratase
MSSELTMSADDASAPSLEINAGHALIRFNRPSVSNRIQPEDIPVIYQHFETVQRRPDIRVLILTGSGRTFSSGFHLGALQDSSDGPIAFEKLTDAIENLSAVTIAKINGPVYGGATDIAVACDFRIGVKGTEMFMPAARLGLHFYPNGLRRWVTRLGPNAAKKLFLTSATLSDQQMLNIGFLDELVEKTELDGTVDALAARILRQAPLPVQGMKQIINQITRGEFDDAQARAQFEASLCSSDIVEGVCAWAEKRPANFVGQ